MDHHFSQTKTAKQSEKVQIFVHGKNYMTSNYSNTINSYLVIYLSNEFEMATSFPKTKVYYQNTSPFYTESFIIDYHFQQRQTLTFRVIINDEETWELKNVLLSHLLQDVKVRERNLLDVDKEKKGELFIYCQAFEQERNNKYRATIKAIFTKSQFQCFGFGSSKNTFYRIVRKKKQAHTEQSIVIYQSQKIKSEAQLIWPQFELVEHFLFPSSKDEQFSIHIIEDCDLIENQVGFACFNAADLKEEKVNQVKILRNPVDKKKKGQICFTSISVIKDKEQITIAKLLKKGLKIKPIISLDFTESNGNWKSATSLHYFSVNKKSAYEQVMQNILDVTLEYDKNKSAYVFGFGAAVKHPNFNTKSKVSYCFPLTMNTQQLQISSKQGIIKTYKQSLNFIQMSGPTYLAPTIRWVIGQYERLYKNKELYRYMIVIILTDGQLNDKVETLLAINQCSDLPISLMIIGIGQEDFSLMHELNDDDHLIDCSNRKPQRKLLKFIQYEKIKNSSPLQKLTEYLQEIPNQIIEYYKLSQQKKSNISKCSKQITQNLLRQNNLNMQTSSLR